MRPKPNPAGFTLVETILVLAVVGLILGAIWLGYSAGKRLQDNALEEQQIADELQMIRSYLLQFNENCVSTATCPANVTPIYNADGSRNVITDKFVPNLLPGSVQYVSGAAGLAYGYTLPDSNNNDAIVTALGANGIASMPSSGNPYGSGPLVLMGFYGFSKQACLDTVSAWAGSPDRIQKSGLVGVIKTNGFATVNDLLNQNQINGAMTSFSTADIQNLCNTDGICIIFVFRLNP